MIMIFLFSLFLRHNFQNQILVKTLVRLQQFLPILQYTHAQT